MLISERGQKKGSNSIDITMNGDDIPKGLIKAENHEQNMAGEEDSRSPLRNMLIAND